MAVRGIGTRSSPIVIDDDDDGGLPPPRAQVDSSPSTSPKTPPPQTIPVDKAEVCDPTPASQESQIRDGKGYSILVRMGYKPGHGLGVNLEGVTSPVKASVRPQRIPSGLGASNVISSRKRPSRNAPNASHTSTNTSEHAPETSSSLPANSSTTTRRRSSGQYSNREHHLNSLPDKIPHAVSSLPHRVDLGSTNGSRSIHAGKIRYVDTAPTKHRPDSHHPTSPQDAGNTHFLDNQAPHVSPNDFPYFFFPAPFLVQSVPLHLPPPLIDSRDNAPVNLPLGLPPRPIQPNPSTSSQIFSIPYVIKTRGKNAVLGMPIDDAKIGGTRGTFPKILEPPPNPPCSLVMELLPRKFRTESFILDWLSQFSFKPRRYELVEGKAFFEFKTERDALNAWFSPRMGGLEGLFGVRLYWYRVLPQTVSKDMDTIRKVNATRTIENSAQSQSRPQPVSDSTDDLGNHLGLRSGFKADLSRSHIPTQKAASPPPPPSPLTATEEDSGVVNINTPAESSESNPDSQQSHNTSPERFSGGTIVTSPTVATRPLAASTALSDPPNNRMDYVTMGDPPPGGVPGFIPGAITSPTVSTSLSPTSSSSHTFPSTFPAFTPEVLNSAVDMMFVDHQAPPALNQGHMQASNSAAETLHVGTEVRGIEFEKVEGAPLGVDDLMETTDSKALAKEQALREMVLQSRKRKLLDKQPTSAPTSTVTSRNALEDLAVNFIADAIARPRPAKRVRITPSAAAMAAWGKRLEQHVESSKAIMAKIQLTRSKAERDRLLAVLREKDRHIEKEKMSLFSCPVEEVVPEFWSLVTLRMRVTMTLTMKWNKDQTFPTPTDGFLFSFFWLNDFLHFTHTITDPTTCTSITSPCKSSYRAVATLVRSTSSSRPSTLPPFSSSRHSWQIIYTTAISINQSYHTLIKVLCCAHITS